MSPILISNSDISIQVLVWLFRVGLLATFILETDKNHHLNKLRIIAGLSRSRINLIFEAASTVCGLARSGDANQHSVTVLLKITRSSTSNKDYIPKPLRIACAKPVPLLIEVHYLDLRGLRTADLSRSLPKLSKKQV
jgi:hypothetical protein